MSKGVVRKRCRDCKRGTPGRAGKMEWCDCGGELVAIRYRQPGRKRKAGQG